MVAACVTGGPAVPYSVESVPFVGPREKDDSISDDTLQVMKFHSIFHFLSFLGGVHINLMTCSISLCFLLLFKFSLVL